MKTMNTVHLDHKTQRCFKVLGDGIGGFNRTVQEASFILGEEHLVFDLLSLVGNTKEEKVTLSLPEI